MNVEHVTPPTLLRNFFRLVGKNFDNICCESSEIKAAASRWHGYEDCEQLEGSQKTKHVSVIFSSLVCEEIVVIFILWTTCKGKYSSKLWYFSLFSVCD